MKPIRVVFLSEAYSPLMGYAHASLPKAMAKLGVDVHLVTLDLPPYYYMPDFKEIYGKFSEKAADSNPVNVIDGYKVHYLPYRRTFGYLRMRGLYGILNRLRPNIVQTFVAISWIPLDAAFGKLLFGYKLFTGNHTGASVFPLAKRANSFCDQEYLKCLVTRAFPGRLISMATEKCYTITDDSRDVAIRFFGVSTTRTCLSHLGVDTEYFSPLRDARGEEERLQLRKSLGITEREVLCIYTGKLNDEKNALLLAQAISLIRSRGGEYSGLFIGEGVQRSAIQSHPFCTVLPFMDFRKLGAYYRASDIAVWPTNETTSMLDAAACGVPLIVSDLIVYREHVDGNGLIYHMNDLDDLVKCLMQLRGKDARRTLGDAGAKKMAKEFSWDLIAKRRVRDYEAALSRIQV